MQSLGYYRSPCIYILSSFPYKWEKRTLITSNDKGESLQLVYGGFKESFLLCQFDSLL